MWGCRCFFLCSRFSHNLFLFCLNVILSLPRSYEFCARCAPLFLYCFLSMILNSSSPAFSTQKFSEIRREQGEQTWKARGTLRGTEGAQRGTTAVLSLQMLISMTACCTFLVDLCFQNHSLIYIFVFFSFSDPFSRNFGKCRFQIHPKLPTAS